MNVEQQLIHKEYFKKYTEESNSHPIQILSELYLEENQKEIADFSYIRFAQGEVYFHHKDFETAIYKWEHIDNELAAWAKKNVADAYVELGQMSSAEGIYLSIETDSPTLKIETNLQLLSIYLQQGNKVKATEVIKEAVAINPDYPEVTELARNLFEENKDYNQAVQLAADEAVRTGSLNWYNTLKQYINAGYTVDREPSYFNQVLAELFAINRRQFEQLAVSLWKSYQGKANYEAWIMNFNSLFLEIEVNAYDAWLELPELYQETYFELINGTRLIKEISLLIPNHLSNWLKIANQATGLFASASVMAWNEMFPSDLTSEIVRDAEKLILTAQDYPAAKEDSLQLFETVTKWAEQNGIEVGNIIKWSIEEIANQQDHQLLLVGMAGSGKADFINHFIGEPMVYEPTSSVITFEYGNETKMEEITDTTRSELADDQQFQEAIGIRRQTHQKQNIIKVQLPNRLLAENQLRMIDTPSIERKNIDYHPFYTYLHFADSLLFILNASQPLTDREKEILKQVSIQAPNLPVHFVLNKTETLGRNQELNHICEKTLTRIRAYFPHAELFTVQTGTGVQDFSRFLSSTITNKKMSQDRITKLQYFVGRAIHYLLDKRIEMENNLVESVHWNEEMVSKLKGAINQVHDLEDEKKQNIKNAYLKMKEEIKNEMLEEIPKILQASSELVREDSDFGKIHLELNEDMNQRVQEYLETSVQQKFYRSLQQWITFAKDEFDQTQLTLHEMGAGFNAMYGEEKIFQDCDFKVLDDWKRDADRMTSGIQHEEFNFFLRFTPSQFLLKSAGKLLAVLPKNNSVLFNKYKSFLESEDYHDSAVMIANQFFKQFELFEKSFARDVNLFFRDPLENLAEAVDEANQEITRSKAELEKMRVKPELYRDPLNLFEVRLRQYEWMAAAGKE